MFFENRVPIIINTFAVINLGWMGNILLSSVLCQDIKKNYPNSKIIFIAPESLCEVAKGIRRSGRGFCL